MKENNKIVKMQQILNIYIDNMNLENPSKHKLKKKLYEYIYKLTKGNYIHNYKKKSCKE